MIRSAAVAGPTPGGRRISGGPLRSLGEGTCRRVQTPEDDVVLVNAAGRLCAFDNLCPHQHFAALHRGELESFRLRCPMHGWTFDVRDGVSVGGEGRLRMHPVSVEGDDVWITVE